MRVPSAVAEYAAIHVGDRQPGGDGREEETKNLVISDHNTTNFAIIQLR